MSRPNYGLEFSRSEDEAIPVLGADFSKALLIETSEDAVSGTFPLNEPVRFSSSDKTITDDLGTGLLADAVAGINSQLGPVNSGADITVIRVAEGADVEATAVNIVTALGTVGEVPSFVNATPRLIWAGRTAWREDLNTASPIVAALPEACNKLLAVAAVDVDETSAANAIDARETMSSERLMPIGSAARVYEGANLVTRSMGPRALGLFMRVDNEHGGKPFNPIAGQAVYGLAGLSRAIPFNLIDGSIEGQTMLEANVGIVVHGEVGVDGAVSDGGAEFIGTDNATTGELWQQIHQVRGADYITVKLMKTTREFLGKKVTADLVEAWLNSIKFILRDHSAVDDILGYDIRFIANVNSPEQIRLGHLTVNLGIEPAPALKLATHIVSRYRPAVEGLVNDIIARLNTVN